MKFKRSIYSALLVVLSLVVCMFVAACKSTEKPDDSSDAEPPQSKISIAQQKAEKVIEEDPNVELVRVEGDKLHIRNKYSKRAVILPFQTIIDGHYAMIREDKELADRILRVREAMNKNPLSSGSTGQTAGWGKTPKWIYRYPGLDISPNNIHSPRPNGTVWGYLTGTHTDSVETIRDRLVDEMKKSGLELTRKYVEKNRVTMIFANIQAEQNGQQTGRQVTCSIMKRPANTFVAIQYVYGM